MTDCPQLSTENEPIEIRHQPFTVLLLLPDDMRNDESCETDWVRRVWVYGYHEHPESLIDAARRQLAIMFGWHDKDDGLPPEDLIERCNQLAPVAIYHGHLFDIYDSDTF